MSGLPKHFRIGSSADWRASALSSGVAASAAEGLGIDAEVKGVLGSCAPDGSLGGLTLPRGMAHDESLRLYLVDARDRVVKAFDSLRGEFEKVLPLAGRSMDERPSIAIAGGTLFVADSNRRRIYWAHLDHSGEGRIELPESQRDGRGRIDLCAAPSGILALDGRAETILRLSLESHELERLAELPANGRYERIVTDRSGWIHVLDSESGELLVRDPDGRERSAQRTSSFETPLVRTDQRGCFALADGLRRPFGRNATGQTTREPGEAPIHAGEWCFDPDGRRQYNLSNDGEGDPCFKSHGTYISDSLDSGIFACRWGRVVIKLTACPPGTRVVVSALTSSRPPEFCKSKLPMSERSDWRPLADITGPLGDDRSGGGERDFFVQNHAGRYLWLRIDLEGDGLTSPVIDHILIHYTSDSLVNQLPAIYSADPTSREFLERYLAALYTTWLPVEETLEHGERLLSPASVAGGKQLERIAGMIGVELSGDEPLPALQRRLMIEPEVQPLRGTLAAVRRALSTGLESLAELPPDVDHDFPRLVEGFRDRDSIVLSLKHSHELSIRSTLWSRSATKYFQLGTESRLGRGELAGSGELVSEDLFEGYAHRLAVYVPRAWLSRKDRLESFERLLERELPAHVSPTLHLLEPGYQIGVSARVGVDMVIGEPPVATLAEEGRPRNGPAGRVSTLGWDTVLAPSPSFPESFPVTYGDAV